MVSENGGVDRHWVWCNVVSDDGGTWREALPGEMYDLNLYRITPNGVLLFPRTEYWEGR